MKTLPLLLSLIIIGCAPESSEETTVSVNTGDPIYGDCVDGGDECTSDESQQVLE